MHHLYTLKREKKSLCKPVYPSHVKQQEILSRQGGLAAASVKLAWLLIWGPAVLIGVGGFGCLFVAGRCRGGLGTLALSSKAVYSEPEKAAVPALPRPFPQDYKALH